MDLYKDLFPNPYCHLDHRGWLGGAIPEGEDVREPTTLPSRRHIGATRVLLSYQPGEESPIKGGVPLRQSKSVVRWAFEPQPVKVSMAGTRESYYTARLLESELFEVIGPGQVQIYDEKRRPKTITLLEALVTARNAAILKAESERPGIALPFEMWQRDFPIDDQVAKAGAEALELARKAAKERLDKLRADAKAEPPKVDPFPLVPPPKTDGPNTGSGGSSEPSGSQASPPTETPPVEAGSKATTRTKPKE